MDNPFESQKSRKEYRKIDDLLDLLDLLGLLSVLHRRQRGNPVGGGQGYGALVVILLYDELGVRQPAPLPLRHHLQLLPVHARALSSSSALRLQPRASSPSRAPEVAGKVKSFGQRIAKQGRSAPGRCPRISAGSMRRRRRPVPV